MFTKRVFFFTTILFALLSCYYYLLTTTVQASSILVDTFSDTTDFTNRYNGISSTAVVGGELQTATSNWHIKVANQTADQTVQFEFKTGDASGEMIRMYMRSNVISGYPNNYYKVNVNSTYFLIQPVVAGVDKTAIGNCAYNFSAGTYYTLRFNVTGNTVSAYVDEVLVCSGTATGDSIVASGTVGMWSRKASNVIDDLVLSNDVIDPTPTPVPTVVPTPTPVPVIYGDTNYSTASAQAIGDAIQVFYIFAVMVVLYMGFNIGIFLYKR